MQPLHGNVDFQRMHTDWLSTSQWLGHSETQRWNLLLFSVFFLCSCVLWFHGRFHISLDQMSLQHFRRAGKDVGPTSLQAHWRVCQQTTMPEDTTIFDQWDSNFFYKMSNSDDKTHVKQPILHETILPVSKHSAAKIPLETSAQCFSKKDLKSPT